MCIQLRVTYYSHPDRMIAAPIVTAIAVITLLSWLLHTERKWGDFLMGGSKLFEPTHNHNSITMGSDSTSDKSEAGDPRERYVRGYSTDVQPADGLGESLNNKIRNSFGIARSPGNRGSSDLNAGSQNAHNNKGNSAL